MLRSKQIVELNVDCIDWGVLRSKRKVELNVDTLDKGCLGRNGNCSLMSTEFGGGVQVEMETAA